MNYGRICGRVLNYICIEVVVLEPIEIKSLCDEDISRLRELFFECDDYFQLIDGVSVCGCRAETEYNITRNGKQQLRYGIYIEAKLVGCMFVIEQYIEVEDITINLLLLTPSFRGKGIGTKVVGQIVENAKQSGFKRVLIGVDEINKAAMSFWKSIGFIDNGHRQRLKHTNRTGDIIYLEKALK
jgi:GNAT superfamily N-acetyltransferase